VNDRQAVERAAVPRRPGLVGTRCRRKRFVSSHRNQGIEFGIQLTDAIQQ